MRPEFDKEFDALLRRTAGRARGAAAPSSRGEGARPAPASPHLDADERAAFAEAALPPAARAAYVAHLADCDECRHSVAGLAASAGITFQVERAEDSAEVGAEAKAAGAGRRSWLGALFAPRALRYVAPALALCLVGVVSFVALRSERGRQGMIARQTEGAPPAAADSAANANSAANSAGVTSMNADMSGNYNSSMLSGAASSANANVSSTATTGRAGETQGGTTGAGTGPSVASPVARPEQPAAAASVAAPTPESVQETVTVTSAPDGSDEMRRPEMRRGRDMREVGQGAGARNDAADRAAEAESRQQQDASRNRAGSLSSSRDAGNAAPPPPPAPRGEARAKTELPPSGRAVPNKPDEDATRTVEGRRFRRANGVWVDASYTDSLPSTVVRRGTGAYRDLVNRLPEVGRVAERLGGEVVVVARGRAYRIKQ